ncbi:hypothetical protein PRK78_007273 [Emydomyces testavorans]|uniref:EDC4-like protein pdc1 beta-propeller domain-containing protein n=1 Tax=Emydomyces testavorans TaxID=2070801 RepID=A0AAF0DPZ8_9EURO|nr:hypothetical protein PRK78_007273 [Emydomyces testavorans]
MSDTTPELQALFASLMPKLPSESASNVFSAATQQQQEQDRASASSPGIIHQPTHYAPPSVSSPLFSPPVAGTPPHHGSDIISPNVSTPRNEPSAQVAPNLDRTAQLLNLLKFNHSPSVVGSRKPREVVGESSSANKQGGSNDSKDQNGHTRGISASDLVAAFMAKPNVDSTAVSGSSSVNLSAQPEKGGSTESTIIASQPGDNAQEILLRLLNRPKAQQTPSSGSLKATESKPVTSPSAPVEPKLPEMEEAGVRKSSPIRTFGTRESRETTLFEPPKPQISAQASIFSYVNPFEQLAAASPRSQSSPVNKPRSTQATPAADVQERNEPESKVSIGMTRPREEFDSQAKAEPAASQESPPEKKLKTKETVPEAVVGVAEKVDAEVEAKLAQAVGEKSAPKEPEPKAEDQELSTKVAKKAEPTTDIVSEGLEKELAAKPAAEEKENKDLAESWENETERIVPVYSFPLKPFVTITWKGITTNPVSVRDDGFMDIARLKKPFDQLDRSLTSATAEYIVYALAKNGGMRIIRQDDGRDRQVFRSSNDRIFNVALSRVGPNPPGGKEEAVLGIGVSGSVYWASLSKGGDNLFERDALDTRSLIFPPFPASDENTSGGQLKTRARPSSRHPEFFGISRGKSIYVVWPNASMSAKYSVSSSNRKVDTEKFYKERALKILTGKAGKDFIFSDDDTVIVSLDKTGRMRFWDIGEVIDASPEASKDDIRVPLLTLVTGAPNEKSWPTSLLFIDKLRPYVKMCAMRYMLVGLRQNHTLQLWDLGLGKAVQELNFPHEKESDAICSVAYHPGSGIIVVGHPTRNCIYFIHLSAPRYTLTPMSQAAYIQGVVNKDEKLFEPQSTACMSGIRELSFGSRGQLRSLELLSLGKPFSSNHGIEEDAALFELYVMHSRGVTCLNIRKADLGWNTKTAVIQQVDGLTDGFIEMKDLRTFPSQLDEQSLSGEGASSVTGNNKEAAKKPDVGAEKTSGTQSSRTQSPIKEAKKKVHNAAPLQEPAYMEKTDKKKKKKGAAEIIDSTKRPVEAPKTVTKNGEIQEPQKTNAVGKSVEPVQVEQSTIKRPEAPAEMAPVEGVSAETLIKGMKGVEDNLSAEFSKCLSRELGGIYNRFNDDRRAQDELSISRQDAILRLVSSTLSENVEKNLARIISNNIESTVVPTIKDVTAASLEKKVVKELDTNLRPVISQSVGNAFPDAVIRAMQTPGTLKAIADVVAPAVVKAVESEFTNVVRNRIVPSIKNEYTRTTDKLVGEVEQMFTSKLKQFESQRISDNVKIEQLTTQVSSLVQVISTMAASQTKFQGEILDMNRRFEEMQLAAQEQRAAASVPVANEQAAAQPSPEEVELKEISRLMEEGDYEEASIKWLQSSQQAELFDNLFVKYGSAYLGTLSPIVLLSVSAAVTSSFETNVMARLDWLSQVFGTVNVRDPDIAGVAPGILDVLIQRLQALYMSIAQHSPHDPVLRKIPPLTRWARDLQEANTYG